MHDEPPQLLDVAQAHEIVLTHTKQGPRVDLPLGEALFRTIAQPISCDVDYPPFDRATMDGYAVRAADVRTTPVELVVVGEVAAGSTPTRTLVEGQVMRINTGAQIPPGADAVVRVEYTEAKSGENSVLITKSVSEGTFITLRATYTSAGQTCLKVGTRLTPFELAVAASAGAATVNVYAKSRIGVLSTGNELVDVAEVPKGAQIRNCNRYFLASLIEAAHAEAITLGIAEDNPTALREKIESASQCDMLCITGGVSMGWHDFVPAVLADMGATFHVQKMAVKPGRPSIFATMPSGLLVFALPGNPVSAFIGFELLVRPAIASREGRPAPPPPLLRATVSSALPSTRDRRSFIPARATTDDQGRLCVATNRWHGSGDPFGLAGANALIVRPPGAPAIENAGDVSVLLLDRL